MQKSRLGLRLAMPKDGRESFARALTEVTVSF
jgi:hypothetical protein